MKLSTSIILASLLALTACVSRPHGYHGDPQSAREIHQHLVGTGFELGDSRIVIVYDVSRTGHSVAFEGNTYLVTLPGFNRQIYGHGFWGQDNYRQTHNDAAFMAALDIMALYRTHNPPGAL